MTANTTAAAEVTAWRNAVVVAYAGSGSAPGTVGLLLLCMTLGSFGWLSL
ncbi:hypothetical protein ABIB17_000122 [Arthrobacter sp. UYEF6]